MYKKPNVNWYWGINEKKINANGLFRIYICTYKWVIAAYRKMSNLSPFNIQRNGADVFFEIDEHA